MPDTQNDTFIKRSHQNSRSLWRNRDYLLLLSGQVISTVGSEISHVAFPLLVLFVTGSPAQAGLAGASRILPYVILSLPAGALVDRWDRKRLMIACDIGRALCLGSIPFAFAIGHLTLLQLYLVSSIEGSLFVFFSLAEVACLPRVVGKEQLAVASGQNVAAQSISFLLGPAFGGALYGLGRFIPFLLDAVSYTASVLSLFFIRVKFQAERVTAPGKLWREVRTGMIWLWRQPLIFFIAVSGIVVHLVYDGLILIVILLAQQQHAPPFAIGIVLAMDGVGSIIGALLANKVEKRLSFRVLMIGSQWLGLGLWFLILLAPNLLVLSLVLAPMYATETLFDVVQFSYRVARIPDELQGRVNSAFRLVAYTGGPLGLTLTGFLLQVFGPLHTVGLLGICLVVFSVITMLNPHVRRAV